MNKFIQFSFVFLGVVFLTACSGETPQSGAPDRPAGNGALAFHPENGGITLPEGFQAVVVAENVGPARHITVRDNGDIYVALSELDSGGGTAALRDSDGDGVADDIEYFGDYTGTGIDIYNGYLYRSSDSEVYRYQLVEDELLPDSDGETVVTGFPEQNSHRAKSFAFDGNGNIYVNVGAPSNACQEESRTPGIPGQDPCPQLERHAGIWQFSASETGQTQQDHGHRYSTGIRNAVALDWNENAAGLYVAQHGRDQLSQLWPDLYNNEQSAELPSEELFKLNDGSDFGWPYAYYDPLQGKKVMAPEYGGDGVQEPDEEYEDPVYAFPGHWAPNDLLFYSADQFPSEYQNGALIAFHGSWNRAPLEQQGYKVVFLPFDGDMPSGEFEVFADGFAGVDQINSPGDAVHRPTGLAIGPDGSLYISDSVRGKIWRVVYTGS